MYYSNKRLKPTTACVIVRRKNTYGTGIEQINCRFTGAMFVFASFKCARYLALARTRTSKLCSATLTPVQQWFNKVLTKLRVVVEWSARKINDALALSRVVQNTNKLIQD